LIVIVSDAHASLRDNRPHWGDLHHLHYHCKSYTRCVYTLGPLSAAVATTIDYCFCHEVFLSVNRIYNCCTSFDYILLEYVPCQSI